MWKEILLQLCGHPGFTREESDPPGIRTRRGRVPGVDKQE